MDWRAIGNIGLGYAPMARSLDELAIKQDADKRAAELHGFTKEDRARDLATREQVQAILAEEASVGKDLAARKAGDGVSSFMRSYNSQVPGMNDSKLASFRGFDANGDGIVDHYDNFESAQNGAKTSMRYTPAEMSSMVRDATAARLAAVDPEGKYSAAYTNNRKLGQADRGLGLQERGVKVHENADVRAGREFGYNWENWNGNAGGRNMMDHLLKGRQVGAMETSAGAAATNADTAKAHREDQAKLINNQLFQQRVAMANGAYGGKLPSNITLTPGKSVVDPVNKLVWSMDEDNAVTRSPLPKAPGDIVAEMKAARGGSYGTVGGDNQNTNQSSAEESFTRGLNYRKRATDPSAPWFGSGNNVGRLNAGIRSMGNFVSAGASTPFEGLQMLYDAYGRPVSYEDFIAQQTAK